MATLVDNKLLFIHIHKNAGTSISFWLHNHADGRKVGGKHIHLFRLLREQRFNVSRDMYNFSFAVVRNPFCKTLSAYKYLKKKSYKRNCKANITIPFPSFEEWITTIDETGHKWVWMSQKKYSEQCDLTLRFENLNEEFKQIQKYLNCYIPLGNENTSGTTTYQSWYNEKTKNIVSNRLKEDIKFYGYEF